VIPGRATGVALSQSSTTLAGRYRLLTILGKGGMGRVWRAYDELLDREVAVKEVPVGGADRPAAQARIVREARAAARLDHPNVIRVYDILRTTTRSWIVMEYVPGRCLHSTVLQDGPLSHRQAARIGLAVLEALRAAHAAGVVHRDVKPQNVLIAADGRVVLTDFGLATVTEDPDQPDDTTSSVVVGSPYYVAPERFRDRASGPETDLWSLGATLYTTVEGRPPFARATVAESLAALISEEALPPERPGPLHPIINGLLRKDPQQRMTAAEAYEALRDVASRTVGVSSVPRRPRPAEDAVVRFRPAVAVPVPVVESQPAAAESEPFRPRRSLRGPLVVATAILIVAGLTGAAVAATRNDAPAVPVPTSRASAPAAAVQCRGVAGQPLTGAEPMAAPYALPSGWFWHRDPAGFRVPLPVGWTRAVDGTSVCFGDPAGVRTFTVETDAPVTRRPLAIWQTAEQMARADGNLPGYQRISMDVLQLYSGGADWEYRWQPATGPRQHVRRLLLATSPTRSYLVQWAARDQDWSLDLGNRQRMLQGFAERV